MGSSSLRVACRLADGKGKRGQHLSNRLRITMAAGASGGKSDEALDVYTVSRLSPAERRVTPVRKPDCGQHRQSCFKPPRAPVTHPGHVASAVFLPSRVTSANARENTRQITGALQNNCPAPLKMSRYKNQRQVRRLRNLTTTYDK